MHKNYWQYQYRYTSAILHSSLHTTKKIIRRKQINKQNKINNETDKHASTKRKALKTEN